MPLYNRRPARKRPASSGGWLRAPWRIVSVAVLALSCAYMCAAPMVALAQSTDGPYGPQQMPSSITGQNGQPTSNGAATGQATNSPFDSSSNPFNNSSQSTSPQGDQPVVVQDDASGQSSQRADARDETATSEDGQGLSRKGQHLAQRPETILARPAPSEFEKFVQTVLGRKLPRFGASLTLSTTRDFTPGATTTVPPDYALNPGDALFVRLTGSVEANLRVVIDSDGRIFLPHIGAMNVAGVRYGDLQNAISARVGEQFRNYHLSVAIAQLHGIRVYVTGYAESPGAYTLSSLSTLVNAVIAAGGPSAGGSYRSVELRRNGQVVTDFDLYDLLLKGDKTHDAILQNDDVIFVAPVGPEVAISGSVNAEAIYEARPGENLGDLLREAGGPSSLADDSKAYVSRLDNLDKMGWVQLNLDQAKLEPVEKGDIFRVTSVADYARPLERQAIVVKIEGEVDRPGRYYMAPNSSVADLMAQAGGLTPKAFVFGSEFDRVTVRQQQQVSYDQALEALELDIAASPLSFSGIDAGASGQMVARAQLAQQIIERMKARKPNGRLVLDLKPQSTDLPADLVLENDDRIYIPPKPTTVGVFGAVYEQGSFIFKPGGTLGDYMKLAGGPKSIAEKSDIFVVRANGAVVAKQQRGWGHSFDSEPALPGDVIFVPIKTKPSLWWDRLVQATTVLYNFGLGAAAFKVLTE